MNTSVHTVTIFLKSFKSPVKPALISNARPAERRPRKKCFHHLPLPDSATRLPVPDLRQDIPAAPAALAERIAKEPVVLLITPRYFRNHD